MTLTHDGIELDLALAHETRRSLEPLSFRADVPLAALRRAWLEVHGREPLAQVDAAEVARAVLRLGCSARDDDHFVVWVVRAGQRIAEVTLLDSVTLSEGQRVIEHAAGGLRRGDAVIALHQHLCAWECLALAEHLLHGARVR